MLRPAIASHNIRSIAHALALAEARGIPPRAYEFQMLYGMADPIKAALVERGHRVRVYTPFGELLPGMAYLVRRLLENTSNESFLRAGFLENLPEEQLLMNPLELLHRAASGRRRRRTDGRRSGNGDGISGPLAGAPALPQRAAERFQPAPSPATRCGRALDGPASRTRGWFSVVIGGRRLEPGQWIESYNPSHRTQLVGRCGEATPEHAEAAIAAAKAAFPALARHAGRRSAPDCCSARPTSSAGGGSSWPPGRSTRSASSGARRTPTSPRRSTSASTTPARCSGWPARSGATCPARTNATFYEPRGVAVGDRAVELPAGDPLRHDRRRRSSPATPSIMKPAEQSPVIAAKLMEVFEEAGFPPGVVNYLPGVGEEIGPTLVEPSRRRAHRLHRLARRRPGASSARRPRSPPGQDHLKRVIAELGGKNAIIVDDDADLDEAVHGVVASAFGYAGQKCSACSRAIVLAGVYDAFVNRLVEATRSLQDRPGGGPEQLRRPGHRRRGAPAHPAAHRDAASRRRGSSTPATRRRSAAKATTSPRTIFADVPPNAAIAQEEIFGPVLAVIKAADLDERLAIANGTAYALTGGVFSRSPGNIERVAQRVPRRQPLHQPQDHRRPGRPPALRRLQAVRHRHQGRRARITSRSSCCRGPSRRTRSGTASRRTQWPARRPKPPASEESKKVNHGDTEAQRPTRLGWRTLVQRQQLATILQLSGEGTCRVVRQFRHASVPPCLCGRLLLSVCCGRVIEPERLPAAQRRLQGPSAVAAAHRVSA